MTEMTVRYVTEKAPFYRPDPDPQNDHILGIGTILTLSPTKIPSRVFFTIFTKLNHQHCMAKKYLKSGTQGNAVLKVHTHVYLRFV